VSSPPVPRRLSRRECLQWGLGGLVGGGLLYTGFIEPKWLELVRVDIPVAELPVAFEGYRIGQISDIHFPRNITVEWVQQAIAMLRAEEPDLIVVTGDFFDGHGQTGVVPDSTDLFAGLTAPDGVFGCLGNHDIALDARGVLRELEGSPINLLLNDHTVLTRRGDRLALASIDDLMYGTPRPDEALGGIPSGTPTVLLAHNPDTAELGIGDYRVDIQLSGHTHGGELYMPFIGEAYVPSRYGSKFSRGLVAGAAHPVYVNRGLCSPRHARFLVRPEVTILTLRSAPSSTG